MGAGRSWTGIPHRAGRAASPRSRWPQRVWVPRCGSKWRCLAIPPLPRRTLLDRTAEDVPNPGTEAVVVDGEATGSVRPRHRHAVVEATDCRARALLFRAGPMQVFSGGRNVALNGKVSAKDSVEEYGWSARGLVDGRHTERKPGTPGESSCRRRAGAILPMTWPWSLSQRHRKRFARPEIIELTQSMKEGVLTWDVPPGEWTLRRLAMEKCQGLQSRGPGGRQGPRMRQARARAKQGHVRRHGRTVYQGFAAARRQNHPRAWRRTVGRSATPNGRPISVRSSSPARV